MRNVHRIVAALLVVCASPLAWAAFSGTDVIVPSVGRGGGAAGSQWSTTIWIHNPADISANVVFSLLLRNQSNPSPATFAVTVPAGQTIRYDNAVETLFGYPSAFGAIRAQSNAKVIVNGRVYSTPSGGDARDTVGQHFSAVPTSFAIRAGESTTLLGAYQTTPQADSLYRYNFGFVEAGGGTATVRVTALAESGVSLASRDYTLGPWEPRQYNITDLLPSVNATDLRLRLDVLAGSGKVVAFGSAVANRSNDPSAVEMSFRDGLLNGSAVGGITEVAHDASLTGAGTSSAPLGIANGGVTAPKIAAGQVVKSLNGLRDAVTLAAGSNVSIAASGGTLTISATGSGGGGLSSVATGTGLTGNGTSGSPVAIANGGVGPAQIASAAVSQEKISASGAPTSGQVLGTNGSQFVWTSPSGGLSLPYSGSSGGTASFAITNANGFALAGYTTGGTGILGDNGNSNTVGHAAWFNGRVHVTQNLVVDGAVSASGSPTGGAPAVLADGRFSAGVDASSSGNTGAVVGVSTNGTRSASGVWGQGSGYSSGVHGYSAQGIGVFGGSGGVGGAQSAGIYGQGSAAAWAGYFEGGARVSQTLAVGANLYVTGNKDFRIDHPLDPANRYLHHASIESSEVLNQYSGNVTTGDDNRAVVQLPEWFEAINTDFRYQLTCIGQFAQAIVEEEVGAGRFTIRTDRPKVKVSWQVTARRNDVWMRAHPFEVEQDKRDHERGTYLSPVEWGLTEEEGYGWRVAQELRADIESAHAAQRAGGAVEH